MTACHKHDCPSSPCRHDALSIAKINTETADDQESELKEIGANGFRLMEISKEGKVVDQQSIWKLKDGDWSPEKEIRVVNSEIITAVYPAGESDINDDVVFMAGVNNMTARTSLDRSTTNTVDINFQHRMCCVKVSVKDKEGRNIEFGDGEGQVQKISMLQPENMTFSVLENEVREIGGMIEGELSPSGANYVVPGFKNPEFKLSYKSRDGKVVNFGKKMDKLIERNVTYKFNFTIDTGELVLLDVGVEIEKWTHETVDGELVLDEGETEEGVYRQGDKVEAGVYIAYIDGGERMAATAEKYDSSKTAYGILLSDGSHQFVMGPTLVNEGYQGRKWSRPFNELVEGVTTVDNKDEALKDFDGKKNSESMLAWAAESEERTAPAFEDTHKFEFAGVADWYVPALGQLKLIMDNIEKINNLLPKIPGSANIDETNSFWSSTQSDAKNAWGRYGSPYMKMFTSRDKQTMYRIRPVSDF